MKNQQYQYPSAKVIRCLFNASHQFFNLAPWELMGDRHIVAVREPFSDRMAYCVVMGSGGMFFGLDALLGDLGLKTYLEALKHNGQKNADEILEMKNSVALIFTDQDELEPEDKKFCQLAKAKFSPDSLWSQFRRFEPGFFPWVPEEQDALFLVVCLDQVMDVARRAYNNPEILEPCDENTFLLREADYIDGKLLWKEKYITPEPMKRIIHVKPSGNVPYLAGVLAETKMIDMTWEADCFFIYNPIEEKGTRPYFPFCYMIADQQSHLIMHVNVVEQNDYGAAFLEQFIEIVKKDKIIPSAIEVRHSHLISVFEPLEIFGIKTRWVDELPVIDSAREEMFKVFGPEGEMVRHLNHPMDPIDEAITNIEQEALRKNKFQAGRRAIYQFNVALNDVEPRIWRTFQVRSNITLTRFAATILKIMGWENNHLHQFKIREKYYSIPYDDFDNWNDSEDERDFDLCDFDPQDLEHCVFKYDFGDRWEHSITLEKILEPVKGAKYPVCLAGANCCPPEDCGGTPGYANFLQAIGNPDHPEHESYREWVGYDFDPHHFSLDEVRKRLRHVAAIDKSFYEE